MGVFDPVEWRRAMWVSVLLVAHDEIAIRLIYRPCIKKAMN